jgi:hypothetical protein
VSIELNSVTIGNTNLEAGDEVIVLGNRQNGSVRAGAVKKIRTAEKKVFEVKQEQPTKTVPEVKPEEPKPEQKPTTTAPAVKPPTPSPASPPTPAGFDGNIAISQDADYVYVTYNFNQAESGKCEAVFTKGSKTKYSGYTYVSTAASKCVMKILKSDLGNSGTWNIEACFYYPYSAWSTRLTKYATFTF